MHSEHHIINSAGNQGSKYISGRLSCYPEYSKYVKNMFTEKEDRREYLYVSRKLVKNTV